MATKNKIQIPHNVGSSRTKSGLALDRARAVAERGPWLLGLAMHSLNSKRWLHMPIPDPQEDEEEPDVKQPPVPPDQEPEIIPYRDPPKPGEPSPMIAGAHCALAKVCDDTRRSRWRPSPPDCRRWRGLSRAVEKAVRCIHSRHTAL